MSGGHWNYEQHTIMRLADTIDCELDEGEMSEYSEQTQARITECVRALRIAGTMLTRVDYLVSGDDSEETFHARLQVELDKLEE
jgi:hypothetical protein